MSDKKNKNTIFHDMMKNAGYIDTQHGNCICECGTETKFYRMIKGSDSGHGIGISDTDIGFSICECGAEHYEHEDRLKKFIDLYHKGNNDDKNVSKARI